MARKFENKDSSDVSNICEIILDIVCLILLEYKISKCLDYYRICHLRIGRKNMLFASEPISLLHCSPKCLHPQNLHLLAMHLQPPSYLVKTKGCRFEYSLLKGNQTDTC